MAIGVFVVASIPAGNWKKRTVLHIISAIFLMFVQAEQNRTPTNCPQCVFSGLKFHCMTLGRALYVISKKVEVHDEVYG